MNGMKRRRPIKDGSIDAGIMMLYLVTPPGIIRTQQEIAEASGCTLQNIQAIEKKAIQKLRAEFQRRQITAESF